MAGLLLNPNNGRPEAPQELLGASGLPVSMQKNLDNGWSFGGRDRLPESVLDYLDKSKRDAGPFGFRASMQSWEEAIYVPIADGAQVLNTTTETIMVPDFTLGAGYLYPGRAIKYTIFGNVSTVVTTPGTIIFALRYGGVAGTALATSGAFAPDPTGASTTSSVAVQWYFVCRAAGTAAASMTMGRIDWSDFDDATVATIVGNLNMGIAPASAPATVNINTTTANALSPTVKFSVATATTQFTANIAILEALS